MPKYKYSGEQTLELPTLGITIKTGDVFDAPAGLTIADVSLDDKATKKTEAAAADAEPAESN